VRSFSSVPDSTYQEYDSAPPADPVLPKNKGLNRFVWNMRYSTMAGIPNVYIESSFRGHKAVPGKYTVTIKAGESIANAEFEILANPLYNIDASTYQQYHTVMSQMESELNKMHKMVNTLFNKQQQINQLLASVNLSAELKKDGLALVEKIKAWDEEMIQRKSLAYDDVENFPNKFTANYLFMINLTESDLPRVNQPSLDRQKELNAQWKILQSTGTDLLEKEIPAFNEKLWKAGIGSIWEK
jgi:hypothetical protein